MPCCRSIILVAIPHSNTFQTGSLKTSSPNCRAFEACPSWDGTWLSVSVEWEQPIQGARSLGADFVVEGSVRRAGDRIRITAQLIDARNGNHVWADRYDRESSDIFSVQDEVVRATVATLEGRMVAAAAVNARRRPTTSWTAYDFFLRGRELSDASLEREATPFFTDPIRVDPDFALAHAWLAMALLGSYWSDADVRTLDQAAHAAQRALELDSNDATVHHANAMVRLWLRQLNRSMLHFERSISSTR